MPTIKLIIYAVAGLVIMGALGALYANGYSSGYTARDIEYANATKALNEQISGLKNELAAAEQKRVEESATAYAEVMQNLGSAECRPLTKEDVARFKRIR